VTSILVCFCIFCEWKGIGQRDGTDCGLQELRTIADAERLAKYPFYHAAFAEFELQSGQAESAIRHFESALKLARNPMERRFFENRILTCSRWGR
jgi:predicted RNA polymerase sigma factor